MSKPPLPPLPPMPPLPDVPLPSMPNELPSASTPSPVLYWVLNFSVPHFTHVSFRKPMDFKGRILMASRQLWSLMEGQTVRSCLIGPGVVTGVFEINGTPTTFLERIGALIFDPTELRSEEPTPLIDIIHPEVIDPTATARIDAIEQSITRVLVRRGMVLAPKKIAVLSPTATVPTVAYEEDDLVRVKIHHTTGLAKARFLLGGQNRTAYNELVRILSAPDPVKLNDLLIFRGDKKYLGKFKNENLANWMIVEKMQGTPIEAPPNATQQFIDEFNETCEFIFAHEDKFIF